MENFAVLTREKIDGRIPEMCISLINQRDLGPSNEQSQSPKLGVICSVRPSKWCIQASPMSS